MPACANLVFQFSTGWYCSPEIIQRGCGEARGFVDHFQAMACLGSSLRFEHVLISIFEF